MSLYTLVIKNYFPNRDAVWIIQSPAAESLEIILEKAGFKPSEYSVVESEFYSLEELRRLKK